MHPILSHIHPNIRTGFLAWLFGRLIIWGVGAMHGSQWPWPSVSAQDAQTLGHGALVHLALHLDTLLAPMALAPASTIGLTILGELMLLLATCSVYHLCRRDTLPGTAERATWLFALCPIWLTIAPTSAWTFGLSLALLALAFVDRAKYAIGLGALTLAVLCRVDMVIVAPIFACLAFRAYAPGRAHASWPWICALCAHALLPASIFLAMLLGGKFGVSLRTLHPEPLIQQQPTLAFGPGWIAPIVLILAMGFVIAHRKQHPKFWLYLMVPALLWPMLFANPHRMMGTTLLIFPLFALLAKSLDDPARERVAMAASFMGTLLVALFMHA